MNSGGGKEGGGGRRATPARIPPPKGSGERLLSIPRELVCSHTVFRVCASPALSVLSANSRPRESNSPACLCQLRDQKIPPAAGRKKEGQREKPKERGREEGKRRACAWLEREVSGEERVEE